MKEQTFKPNNKIWTVLIVLYIITAVVYTYTFHDSLIRIDALFMNPLLGFVFFYVLFSRKVVIDSSSIRSKIMGLTSFRVPLSAINRLQLGDSLLGGRWLMIEYTAKTGKMKKVHVYGGFDLKDIYERLAVRNT